MVLDGVAGLRASADGKLTVDASPCPLRTGLHIENVNHCGCRYTLEKGVLRPA
jgi:hypothetical protein